MLNLRHLSGDVERAVWIFPSGVQRSKQPGDINFRVVSISVIFKTMKLDEVIKDVNVEKEEKGPRPPLGTLTLRYLE